MSIRQLPDDVAAALTASAAITSLNHVVAGLLKNSLDAGARRIHVRLDYARGSCVVEDDGLGIEPCEFKPDGGLGKRHHTSKCPPNPKLHGSRGEFLAAVANLSLLSVTSHHHRHLSQGFLSIHNSRVLARQLPASPEQRLETFSHGTRVAIHALFASMPVRAKHQAAIFSERAGVNKQWRLLVWELVALILSWPTEVSVFLAETAARRELRLQSTANTDILLRTSRLFTQASLADSDDADSWTSVSASARHVRIRGFISTTPVATRRSQALSLGIQPISNRDDSNALYETINNVFRNSSFGIVEDIEAGAYNSKPRKGLERWPMFFLQILLPGGDATAVDDVLNHSHKALAGILDLLKAVSHDFLKKQGLRPRTGDKSTWTRSHLSTEPRTVRPFAQRAAKSDIRPETLFSDWNRVKVGWAAPRSKQSGVSQTRERQPMELQKDKPRLIGQDGRLLRAPFRDDAALENEGHHESVPRPGAKREAEEEATIASDATSRPQDTPAEPQRKKARFLENRTKPQPSKWLQGILQSWENPVFATTQKTIPNLCDSEPAPDASHGCRGKEQVRFESRSMSLSGRLSRSALGDAQVIAQVDSKFILVKLSLETAKEPERGLLCPGLVMIDQHAADERCRLEELMRGYFKAVGDTGRALAVTEPLEEAVVFEASGREADLLEQHREHFESWGVVYRVHRAGSTCQVKVARLPPSILERCRSEPRVLIDLLRRETWALADGDGIAGPRGEARDTGTWTSRFRGCPSGILDLLYSRSCRSAIMFNDELSWDECAQLVQRLAQCAFPFQCAHGRPSMVPLADLGSGAGRIWRDAPSVGIQGWKRWMDGHEAQPMQHIVAA